MVLLIEMIQNRPNALVGDGHLEHEPGLYSLPAPCRARSITSKRTLFNAGHIQDLEKGARFLEAELG